MNDRERMEAMHIETRLTREQTEELLRGAAKLELLVATGALLVKASHE